MTEPEVVVSIICSTLFLVAALICQSIYRLETQRLAHGMNASGDRIRPSLLPPNLQRLINTTADMTD